MIKPEDVAALFDIYVVSAEELCAGIIDFEPDELLKLAEFYGVGVDVIVKEVTANKA